MRPHLPRAALLALTLLGGLVAGPPAVAAASHLTPPRLAPSGTGKVADPDCTLRRHRLSVKVDPDRRTAKTTASWTISCRRPTSIMAELQVNAPHRKQRQVKGAYGTSFTGHATAKGAVNPRNPRQTAVLVFRTGDTLLGPEIRKCATKPDGSESCHGGRDGEGTSSDRDFPNSDVREFPNSRGRDFLDINVLNGFLGNLVNDVLGLDLL
jgi:hypothetical protein